MGKLSFLVGFGAGYVAGAAAGRDRYEQIKLGADKVWQHPAVQDQLAAAKTTARERGPQIAAAAGQAAIKGAGQAAKGVVNAGYQAATGTKHGPVVPGSIAPADDSATDPDAPPQDDQPGSGSTATR